MSGLSDIDDRLRRAAERVGASDELRAELRELQRETLTGDHARPRGRTGHLAGAPSRRQRRAYLSGSAGRPTGQVRSVGQLRSSQPKPAPSSAPVQPRSGGRKTMMIIAGAVVVIAVVALARSGGHAAPTVRQIVPLGSGAQSGPAPGTHGPPSAEQLAARIQDTYLPDLQSRGWHADSAATASVSGRSATTVLYSRAGQRIALSCLASPAIVSATASGARFETGRIDARNIVVWNIANHTCVLSGSGTSIPRLRGLAASIR